MSDFITTATALYGGLGDSLPEMFAVIAVFSIPIVAILSNHQRKMAQLINERHQQQAVNPQIAAELGQLRAEVARLRDVVNQQVLASDRAIGYMAPPAIAPEPQPEAR